MSITIRTVGRCTSGHIRKGGAIYIRKGGAIYIRKGGAIYIRKGGAVSALATISTENKERCGR